MKFTLRITEVPGNRELNGFVAGMGDGYFRATLLGSKKDADGKRKVLRFPGLLESDRNKAELIKKTRLHLAAFGFAESDIVVEHKVEPVR